MGKTIVPTLSILVAGDPNSGKANFIKRFLEYYPPAAEVSRKNQTTYFIYNPDTGLRIHLHDVVNVEAIEHGDYDDMDLVVFCYAANDPGSFKSLEKWIRLMEVGLKENRSFLVADWSNLGIQQDVAKSLSEKANKLKEHFGIDLFIECYLDDKFASDEAFDCILKPYMDPMPSPVCMGIDNGSINKILQKNYQNAAESVISESEFALKNRPSSFYSHHIETLNNLLDKLILSSESEYF